jgi:ribonuclease HII
VRTSWIAYSPSTIDQKGLHRCNLLALSRALESLEGEYALAVVDGFDLGRPELRAWGTPGADYKSAAVAAASVVAKVVRDRLMKAVAHMYRSTVLPTMFAYGTIATPSSQEIWPMRPSSSHLPRGGNVPTGIVGGVKSG